ncbi:MAG: integrase core domain-containing protein [Terriglobales bacterium]
MLLWSKLILGSILRLLQSRRDLLLENLALRQQLAVLRRHRRRPRLHTADKLFWVFVRRLWNGWQQSLAIVTPATVVRWHRTGFRLYWAWLSWHRVRVGRKPTSRDLRALIFQMVAENPTWGAPRIHGELQMLGFNVSERTVSRWVRRAPKNPEPAKRWLTFLHNHREVIAAMDFFTVPTFTFGVLYCFFVIAHDRRRILHFNVTRNPTGAWVVQQLREAFPYEAPQRYLIFDRDAKFSLDVVAAVRAMGSEPTRTSFRSPWQNGVAERWVGSCRRDLLDHVIVRDERHLKRLLCDYVRHYHHDRTRLGLAKQTPAGRIRAKAVGHSRIVSVPRMGGLHHRYDLAA